MSLSDRLDAARNRRPAPPNLIDPSAAPVTPPPVTPEASPPVAPHVAPPQAGPAAPLPTWAEQLAAFERTINPYVEPVVETYIEIEPERGPIPMPAAAPRPAEPVAEAPVPVVETVAPVAEAPVPVAEPVEAAPVAPVAPTAPVAEQSAEPTFVEPVTVAPESAPLPQPTFESYLRPDESYSRQEPESYFEPAVEPQPFVPEPEYLAEPESEPPYAPEPEPEYDPEPRYSAQPEPYFEPAAQPYFEPAPAPEVYFPPEPAPAPAPELYFAPAVTPEPEPVYEPEPVTRAVNDTPELAALRQEVSDLLTDRIGTRLNDARLSEADLDAAVRRELASIIDERGARLAEAERIALIRELADDALGLGPLQSLLDDPTISEIMVNGPDEVFVERRGRIQRVPVSFRSEERLRRVIERIVSRVGRRIDESSPLVDARLADGSRVNAIIPPLSVSGPALTIRKFAAEPYKARDMVGLGTLSEQMVELLHACVQARLNIIVSGGTGTGKTTLLNVLSSFIPPDERIVTIEDSVELQLQQEHVVRLESRPPNLEGRGEVTIRDLVRNSLRMRPDRIIVGECRGGETLDMLQSMNTGHDGSLSTLHANSPRDAIARLETLVLMAGMDLPHRAIREQIASAIDIIIHITRLRDGTRRVTHVTEVLGMENDVITLQDIYRFDFGAGVDSSGRFLGTSQPTGIRPRFVQRFEELGVPFNTSIFATEPNQRDWL